MMSVPKSLKLVKESMVDSEDNASSLMFTPKREAAQKQQQQSSSVKKTSVTSKPLLSRERVDRALETLKKSSSSRAGSFSKPFRSASIKVTSPDNQTPSGIRVKPQPQKAEIRKTSTSYVNPVFKNEELDPVAQMELGDEDVVESEAEASNKAVDNLRNSTPQYGYSVVVAIDFGTTYSGYAYSFTHDPENIHIMRKWEGNPINKIIYKNHF